MKILVSNDDGIHAEGIAALAEAMNEFGEVYVVAPDRERSGAGHSLTLHRPIRIFEREKNRYAVDGTPTDCVMLGLLEVFKGQKPDLVVSGINHGPNLGDDVTYSGTVSAALEATLLGVPALAFSLVMSAGDKPNFAPAAEIAKLLVKSMKENTLNKGTLLNVNVPNIAGAKTLPHEITCLGSRRFTGSVVEKLDPRNKKYYWIGGEENALSNTPGTDSAAILNGQISITPIKVDYTDHSFISTLKSWKL